MFKKVVVIIIVLVGLGLAVYSFSAKINQEANMDNESQQPLHGVITGVEQGADGVQVALDTDQGSYSVTISIMQAEVFGRFDQIAAGAELEVSGTIIEGMEPPLIVAEHVRVLGSEADYVMNLKGTVTQIELGKDGITATVEASSGTLYQAVISIVTTEIVYIEPADEIQEGTVLNLSGVLMDLGGDYIAVDRVVVNPNTPVDQD